MPALPAVPKVIRVSYKFAIGEDLGAICREFYQYTGSAATATELATAASGLSADYAENLAPLATPDRVLELVTITDLSSSTAPEGEFATSVPGTRGGVALPASAAVLASQKVLRRYRGGHPRTYWPFGSDGDMADAQTWTAGFVTAAHNALNTYYIGLAATMPSVLGTVTNCNVSYYEGFTVHTGTTGRARNVSTPRGTPIVDLVVDFVIQAGIAQIRKRLLGLA